jgi:hypothetical protein
MPTIARLRRNTARSEPSYDSLTVPSHDDSDDDDAHSDDTGIIMRRSIFDVTKSRIRSAWRRAATLDHI